MKYAPTVRLPCRTGVGPAMTSVERTMSAT
jgi:hypothetical protein